MNTTETKYYKSQPITIMADNKIIQQLPKEVQLKLGPLLETGFHLGEGRRDLFFQHATIQYKLGSRRIAVTFE